MSLSFEGGGDGGGVLGIASVRGESPLGIVGACAPILAFCRVCRKSGRERKKEIRFEAWIKETLPDQDS